VTSGGLGACASKPIKSIIVDESDNVVIELEWTAEMPKPGQPGFGTWRMSSHTKMQFPNLVVPYVLEDTPEKGDRIRFAAASIIFVERIEGVNTLDTSKIENFQTP
jgi:hypothetical protein